MATGTLLSACATKTNFASLEGSCSSFPRPEYQIKGRAKFDQIWADKITEAGVAGCGWTRPLQRPAELDRVSASQVTVTPPTKPDLLSPTKPATVTVRTTVWQKIRHPIKTFKNRKHKEPTS